MKRISFYFLFAMVIQSFCFAGVTKLPAPQRKILEDASRFHEVHATTNLPPAIVALCADANGRLAEPGKQWESTDLIKDPSLPQKRLIWAAVSDEYYVVHYERGGRGHSFHVLVATLAKGETKPNIVWRGVGDQLKDYAAFLDALRSGKLDDTLEYAH
jgi:hypothetical protein